MNTQATMQSNQTERNTFGRSLPCALLATLTLTLNTMKLFGLGSLAGSANFAAAAVANLSAPMYWDATSKRISDWKQSIRGEHSPCRQD